MFLWECVLVVTLCTHNTHLKYSLNLVRIGVVAHGLHVVVAVSCLDIWNTDSCQRSCVAQVKRAVARGVVWPR